jgi:hypothetical protein
MVCEFLINEAVPVSDFSRTGAAAGCILKD